MTHGRASKKLADTIIVNAIVEAISNNVASLSAPTAAGPPGTGPCGAGGFATALAAAQGVSATLPATSSGGSGTLSNAVGSTTASAAASGTPVAQRPERKTISGNGIGAAGNNVAPAALGVTANLVQWLGPQTSLPPSISSFAPVVNLNVAEGTVSASSGAAPNTAGLSQPASAAVGAVSVPPSAPISGSAVFSSEVTVGDKSSSLDGSIAAAPAPSGTVSTNTAQSNPQSGIEPRKVSAEASGNMQPAAISSTPAPLLTAAISRNTANAQESASSGNTGWGTTEPALQTSPPVETARPASIPVASASSNSGPPLTLLASADTNPPAIQENVSDTATANPAPPTIPPVEAAASNPPAAVASAQNLVASVLNPLPARAATRIAAPRAIAADSTPSVRGANQGPASTLATVLPSGADSREAAPAGQTPFSVFFSAAGPGTESAASVLPRMILPATNSQTHTNFSSVANSAVTSVQSGGANGGVAQTPASQAAKGAPPGSQGESAPTGPPVHRDADSSSANVPVASLTSQTSVPGAPSSATPPVSVGQPVPATLVPPPATQPTLADLPAKPDTSPGAAGNPANAVPAAPQVQPAALPGPVQVAQMVSRVGQSEMRIGLNTSAFGSVEVRTVVRASDVGLMIGSEKGDLRGLLSNEMPALTNNLQQQNLRLNSVNFMQGFASSNNASGGGSDSQQRSFVPPPQLVSASSLSEAAGSDSVEVLPAEGFVRANSNLNILA